ncbi:MAG: hypothetical protein JW940_00510 [Polyangiaceae bacterium]|nr:hypothetical protein [Polyangiaceae bacterium]
MPFSSYSFSEMALTNSWLSPSDERDAAVLLSGYASAGDEEPGTPAWGTLGLVFRPRRPEAEAGAAPDTKELFARAFAVRHGERLIPVAYRDPRLNRIWQPEEGDLGLVGYGGGRITLEDTPSKQTRIRHRVPFSGGTMEILLDPDETSITVTHSGGMAIELKGERVRVAAPTVYIESPDVILGADGRPVACVGDIVGGRTYALTTAPGAPMAPNPAPAPGTGVEWFGKILSGVTGVRAGNGGSN